MTIIGKWNKPISWLTPEDAARAILIMSDPSVKPDYYNIFSFTASPLEIISELDSQNYSTLKLKKRSLFFAKIRHKLCQSLSKLRICKPQPLDRILKFNMTQVLNQDLAISKWDWEPKFDLKNATENALNWYINHVI
jgi:nucleoside-diphosphate-sugar epimerase